MVKPESVTIVSITSSSYTTDEGSGITHVFGLGDDQKVYRWETNSVWYEHTD